MAFDIKKEDPLEYNDYMENYSDDDDDGEESYKQTSSSSNQAYSRSNDKIEPPTTVEMPTKDEILNMPNLDWKIALQRHKNTQELGNDSRSKIAKLIIKNIYERKFAVDGNYNLKMTVADFNHLTDILIDIFPTEVVETYFVRSMKSKAAAGKLYNAFVNIRAEIAESGLVQTVKRNMNKPEKPKGSRMEIQSYTPSPSISKFPDAMNICQSSNFDDPEHLTEMWDSCYEHRQKLLRDKSALKYFNMFPYLKDPDGYKLLLNDTKRKFFYCEKVDRFELVAPKIFERIQRMFRGDSLPKNYLQNFQDSADPLVLSLILLPYLFTVINKRSSAGAPKVTKQEMYNRFFPHFPSLTELEDFENTQDFNEKPVQVCVVGNLNERPYSIIRVFNTKYHFGSPRDAMNVAFRIFLALNLEFPYESTQMWIFLKKFAFKIEDERGAKIYPQVETMINEFNLYLRNNQHVN